MTFGEITNFIRQTFNEPENFIALHSPVFKGNEKKYLLDTIDSTFVSSVGSYVTLFEELLGKFTGGKYVIATTNGTIALHLALVGAGVRYGDEVITQPLTFVATSNAIRHAGADPIFVDVDRDTMGLSPLALQEFLNRNAEMRSGICYNKATGKRIAACTPMHTFGFPLRIDEIVDICNRYSIPVVEDAAESLGSYYKGQHTGTFGIIGTFSFNGNKTVTCGGGGAVVTNDKELGARLKHLSTTAKVPHSWEFVHDEVGYNYRMPNLNAALACAQLEQLEGFLENKRQLAKIYQQYFAGSPIGVVTEIKGTKANYWLNAILLKDAAEKNAFLEYTNAHKVMTRPAWKLMNELTMYKDCQRDELKNASWLEERIVNIPSSYKEHYGK